MDRDVKWHLIGLFYFSVFYFIEHFYLQGAMGKIMKKNLIITNNKRVVEEYQGNFEVDFVEGYLLDVLKKARDYVHMGAKLISHPLAGSIKPNETIYKSIVVEMGSNSIDVASVELIENSILAAERMIREKPFSKFSEKILRDLEYIDFLIVKNALD